MSKIHDVEFYPEIIIHPGRFFSPEYDFALGCVAADGFIDGHIFVFPIKGDFDADNPLGFLDDVFWADNCDFNGMIYRAYMMRQSIRINARLLLYSDYKHMFQIWKKYRPQKESANIIDLY